MSLASKVTLITSSVVSLSIIVYIHYKQEYDRKKLHLGVIRDLEKQRRRKIENIYLLQQQTELTKDLTKDALKKPLDSALQT